MIVGLVGFIGSGKDTVAEHFIKAGFERDSFAAFMKSFILKMYGRWLPFAKKDSVVVNE